MKLEKRLTEMSESCIIAGTTRQISLSSSGTGLVAIEGCSGQFDGDSVSHSAR